MGPNWSRGQNEVACGKDIRSGNRHQERSGKGLSLKEKLTRSPQREMPLPKVIQHDTEKYYVVHDVTYRRSRLEMRSPKIHLILRTCKAHGHMWN